MLASMVILYGVIFGYKLIKGYMIQKFMRAAGNQTVTVSTSQAAYQMWQPSIKASGSIRAVQGIDVTSEIAGLVRSVHFSSGTFVKSGDLLVKLNDEEEIAQLQALKSIAELAKITYERDREQLSIKAISQAVLDGDLADLKTKEAQAAAQAALVSKKNIIAPFDGSLGISTVNPGTYINPGDKIVTLQSLDPIYVDFAVPQQILVQLAKKQKVYIKTDTYPGHVFTGEISTIDPKIDLATRNGQVEATVSNSDKQLLPGMFVELTIHVGEERRYLTLPQTAISFNPYGEIVYIVTQEKKDTKNEKSKPILTVKQSFVTVGESRGDQIAVLTGLNEGDEVVTSGQLKLRNGSQVSINNTIQPNNSPTLNLVDE